MILEKSHLLKVLQIIITLLKNHLEFNFLIKKIDFVLAKISGSTDVSHIIGPFVFFPEKK